MIEKLVQVGILFDFYGNLLTEKQYTAIDLYYINDLSLAEIGERIGVSRQGVFDTIRRAEKKLFEYEDKLKLVKKFKDNQEGIRGIIKNSREIIGLTNNKDINEIKYKAEEIINIGERLID